MRENKMDKTEKSEKCILCLILTYNRIGSMLLHVDLVWFECGWQCLAWSI